MGKVKEQLHEVGETEETKKANENNRNLLNAIIAETFARHTDLSTEEYLKMLGFADSGKTEAEAIRISMFNVLLESTKEFLQAQNTLKLINGLLKTYMNIDENKIKGEQE